ncbi:MAG TPA: hypothetical protein DDY68_00490, partial [Porphyromonadaceae bacterium]|nr:hypothetical protein [Porphyromonadaceae bacterium]
MTKEKSIHKSKSRIWISILAVVIVLCLTNRYWLGFISVPIQFDVKGGGNKCKVAVLLNYKDDEEFKKMKHSSQTFDLQKNSHIEMNLRCLKPAKRIKIVLSNLEQNQSISIENLMFYDQKLPIENGEKVRI